MAIQTFCDITDNFLSLSINLFKRQTYIYNVNNRVFWGVYLYLLQRMGDLSLQLPAVPLPPDVLLLEQNGSQCQRRSQYFV